MTVPLTVSNGPETLQEWIRYLHNVAQEPKDSPHYAEARAEMGRALRHINALQVAGNQRDFQAASEGKRVGLAPAVGTALLHGLSLGSGEPLAGFFSKLTGGSFAEGAARYREGLGNVEAQHPTATAAGEVAGMFALPAGQVGAGLSTIKAGVPLTASQGIGLLGRGALAGAVPAGIAGFSAGGEDPGDIPARVTAGERAAVVGGILGLLGTGVGARLARRHVERVADIADKGERRALTSSRLAESRARLAKLQPPVLPPGVTADEMAVAKALGVPVEQVRGRVGAKATPSPPPLRPQPLVPSDPLDVPAYLRSGAPMPIPLSWREPVPVKPRGVGGHSYSGTYPRSPTIVRSAETAAQIRRLSFADLQQAYNAPGTPSALRELLAAEFARRGIAFTPDMGILAPTLMR